jgi:hypothetical protein
MAPSYESRERLRAQLYRPGTVAGHRRSSDARAPLVVHLDTDGAVGQRFRNAWASSTLSAASHDAAEIAQEHNRGLRCCLTRGNAAVGAPAARGVTLSSLPVLIRVAV